MLCAFLIQYAANVYMLHRESEIVHLAQSGLKKNECGGKAEKKTHSNNKDSKAQQLALHEQLIQAKKMNCCISRSFVK